MGSNPTPSASEKPSHIKALRPYDWAFLFANLPLLHMIFGKKSCLPSDGLGFRQGQDVVHYVCGRKLGLIIQVAVDVCRGADIAVAQPFLDLLHGHVVGQQQRSAAVPEIVEADMPQTFQFQQLAEIAAEIPGIKNVPHYIHEHIAVVFPVVAVAADPLVFLLLLLQGQQLLPDIVDQRKRAQTGFRLGAILADDLILAVYLGICYDVSDGDGIALKVDGVPSQAQSLAAPEPVERGDLDQQRPLSPQRAAPAPPNGSNPRYTSASSDAPPCRRGCTE